ncbi:MULTISPECIES: helix-turn-helix domain-containing protein [unclassified Streptomyces]|uniref:helix-turn-helix domain-containing protein n=1 Tax=unclassified Streptomyces TaxID=2593676 RepID=UPI0022B6708A|nr:MULTISPECIES: helix-turn-helix transcriptional regulator [unclassified Streptomyces]MCZ7417017.1 helix-turn-helix transcriptional regulator [Streptomyces sp. WMMC897]MCZ7433155.1 helix-turn-helix transcriptional regulator [Streptomyces sp. WMMC1477]
MGRPARPLTPHRSARHLFGAEIRRHRELAGMSLERLADIVNYSKSHLARIETAEAMVPPTLPARLDAAFGSDGLFERLYGLARTEIHPDRYRRRMELEAQARVIDEYAGHLVPGLFQTEPYAHAVFRVHNDTASAEEIEEKVAARMSRQTLLHSKSLAEVSVILDEAVIRRPVGGREVMREQLRRLAVLADTPNTVMQLLPFTHGEHALLGGALTLMTLGDRSCVAYEESIDSGTLFEDEERVAARRRAYDRLRAHALSPKETAAILTAASEALSP